MPDKIILMRNEATGAWKYCKMDPKLFKSKSWLGYEYFGSHLSVTDAMVHAKDIVEDDLKKHLAVHKHQRHKTTLPAVVLPPKLTTMREELYPDE